MIQSGTSRNDQREPQTPPNLKVFPRANWLVTSAVTNNQQDKELPKVAVAVHK